MTSLRGTSRRSGVLLSTGVNATTLVLGLATGIITARAFEPDGRGIFLAVVLWSGTVASFAMVGLEQALVYGAQGDGARALILSRALRRRVVLQSASGAAIAFGVGLFLTRDVGEGRWLLACAGTLPVIFNGLTQLRLAPLLIAERYLAWNLVRLTSPMAYVVALGALTATNRVSIFAALLSVALGSLASLVVATIALGPVKSGRIDLEQKRKLVRYGHQIMLISVPGFLASRIDQLLIGVLASTAALGIYAVAVSVASVMEVPKLTIEQLSFPYFVRTGWVRRSVRVNSLALIALAAAGGSVLYLISLPLIPLAYGEAYRTAAAPLPPLLLATSIRIGSSYLGSAGRAAGQLKMIARAQGIALTATSVFLLLLCPVWAVQGAALAVLLGQVSYFALVFVGLHPHGLTSGTKEKS